VTQMLILKRKKNQIFKKSKIKYNQLPCDVAWFFWSCGSVTWQLTAMSASWMKEINGRGIWLMFVNFMRFLKFCKI